MWRQLICFLTIAISFNFVTTKVLTKQPARRISNSALQPLHGTAFDYDFSFAPQPRQSSAPTQRPLINYFNNLVQNIRLPVPYIRWNMTNPLVNLFNAGATNVIDTPVGNYNQRKTKRKSTKKTRTQPEMHTKHTKKHKHANTAYDREDEQTQQTTSFNDYEEPYTVDFNPYRTLYFYDARTGQYYKMQNLHTNYLSANNPAKQQQKRPYKFAEELVPQEIAAQIEPPSEEASVEHNDSDEEALQQTIEEETSPDSQEIKESEEVEVIPPDMNISEEESSLGRQSEVIKQSKQHKVETIDRLHNSLAAYMTDDHFNKMRQRANTKQTKTMQRTDKSQPRRKFAYYLLKPF